MVSPVNPVWETEQDDRVNALVDLARALYDHPVLDDDAYYQREAEAWTEFASDGLRYDVLADMPVDMPDETVDAIGDAWPVLWPMASEKLDYYNGFTGEHAPDFGELVAGTIITSLFRFFGVFTGEVAR